MVEFLGKWNGGRWRYDPSERLGGGGFAAVYSGLSESGAQVAVKVLSADALEQLPEKLLQREVEIAEKLRGQPAEHLLQSVDVGEIDGAGVLVMPRAEYSLAALLPDGPLEESRAVSILREVAAGLRELHQALVFHRDLKPENVLFVESRWKLADFGIARDATLGTGNPTFRGAGTPPYMAPELWDGRSPTVKTDLYALGCLAYALLAGAPPFSGRDVDRQHREETPPTLRAELNVSLRDLVLRLLHKQPENRPQDARAVEERLDRLALPLSAAQEQLQRSLEARVKERSAQEALAERARAAQAAIRSRRLQAMSDLQEILRDAQSELERVIPDCALVLDPVRRTNVSRPGLTLSGDDLVLTIRPWEHVQIVCPQDSMAAGCEIFARSPGIGGDFLIANGICEVEKGRLCWKLYRFRRMALSRSDRYYARYRAPDDREHGLERRHFEDADERQCMLQTGGMHVWTLRKLDLTGEGVAALFAEAHEIRSLMYNSST